MIVNRLSKAMPCLALPKIIELPGHAMPSPALRTPLPGHALAWPCLPCLPSPIRPPSQAALPGGPCPGTPYAPRWRPLTGRP